MKSAGRKPEYLIGYGSDDHRINQVRGTKNPKPLILGNTLVSKEFSPVAHSDGDVVSHAISNALFLAVGERDVGYHFSDTDPDYAGIEGSKLLKYAMNKVDGAGYMVNNITVMITAGRPKLSPYIEKMKAQVARSLSIKASQVGIGATTGEGLTEHGRGKGINAVAMVSLKKKDRR
jgi:2-C-methyl-D-erythritol 2,4-cyclodiphosphate synthase